MNASAKRLPISVAIIAIATVYMIDTTWLTWPDAIYDFGSQLYYPWQMNAGKHLYTDIAYFNGPLSQYFNAAIFTMFGVSLRTLILVNLAIVFGVIALIYHIVNRLSDALTATCSCVVFVTVFAFSQYVGIGNYNWICPYTHEVTHGVALSLAMVAAIGQLHRTGQPRWMIVSGLLLGLVFLTKAEIFVPAAGAALVGLILWVPGRLSPSPGTPGEGRGEGDLEGRESIDQPNHPHPNPLPGYRERGPYIALLLVLSFAGVITIVFAMIALTITRQIADRAILGSWPWIFNRQIAQLQFYRQGLGVDDVAGNLQKMLVIGGGLSLIFATLLATALAPRRWRIIAWILLTGELIAMLCLSSWAMQIARPWPVALVCIVGFSVKRAWQCEDAERPQWALRATLAMLAFGLLGKMLLNARVWQYGFALAMPAAVVLIEAIVGWIPRWIAARGKPAHVMRWGGAAFVIVAMFCLMANQIPAGSSAVGENGDRFIADHRGEEVKLATRWIEQLAPPGGTVAVMPQGLMLNYLARRADSVPSVNLMPPEVLSIGEDAVVEQLKAHPPDLIVLSERDVDGGTFVLPEGDYHYGRKIVSWVRANYRSVIDADARSELRLSCWKRMPV